MKTVSAFALIVGLSLVACGGESTGKPVEAAKAPPATSKPEAAAPTPADYRAIVDAPDRSDADKALDVGRKPADILAFAGIKPGMKVADLASATGYTTELLARGVGPTGTVYAQNSKWMTDMFASKVLPQRLAKPVNKNVVSVTREFDDPLPPEAKDLDLVIAVFIYHDLFWMDEGKIDRAKMNAAVLRALKPGGSFVIIDHSGRPGTGATEVTKLHRIEETVVRDEILAAGFKLASSGDFLRNPQDTRDWSANPFAARERRGTSDRFALKFSKP